MLDALSAPIRLGTCAFTANGWVGSFYPRGLRQEHFLEHYAEEFDTVELDVTWYRVPTVRMIEAWYQRTPKHFVFAAKIPQTITHDKVLVDCQDETREFIASIEGLREKLGPLLLQFPYFNIHQIADLDEFLKLLDPYLAKLPKSLKFAVEVRNKDWVGSKLLDVLRLHNVAFSLTDHAWMHRPEVVVGQINPVTADFTYIRWLGDSHVIEEMTKAWDKVIVDRTRELGDWADICQEFRKRGVDVYGYVNNHYAGHSPASIRSLLDLVDPSLRRHREKPRTLFEM